MRKKPKLKSAGPVRGNQGAVGLSFSTQQLNLPPFGSSPDIEAQIYWGLGALDWSRTTTKPSRKKLLELGLNDVADELWPPGQAPGVT